LLVLVGLPYVKCRLDLFYQKVSGGGSASILGDNEQEEMENEELENPQTKPMRKLMIRLIRLFRKVYPIINFLYYGSNLAYNVAYLFGKTRYYTPWLHLLGLEVKRMSMNDYVS
jgi:peroxin-12